MNMKKIVLSVLLVLLVLAVVTAPVAAVRQYVTWRDTPLYDTNYKLIVVMPAKSLLEIQSQGLRWTNVVYFPEGQPSITGLVPNTFLR